MIRFIVFSLLIPGAVVLTTFVEGGNPLSLIQFSAFLLAIFPPVFATLAVWPLKAWSTAFKSAFGSASPEERKTAGKLWNFFTSACGITAVLGLILGVIYSLENLGQMEKLGEGLALSLITPLYSLGLALFAQILKARAGD